MHLCSLRNSKFRSPGRLSCKNETFSDKTRPKDFGRPPLMLRENDFLCLQWEGIGTFFNAVNDSLNPQKIDVLGETDPKSYICEFRTILKFWMFGSLPTFHFAESILSTKHLQKWNKTREIRISHRCDTPKDGVTSANAANVLSSLIS